MNDTSKDDDHIRELLRSLMEKCRSESPEERPTCKWMVDHLSGLYEDIFQEKYPWGIALACQFGKLEFLESRGISSEDLGAG